MTEAFDAVDIIAAKRDRNHLTDEQIDWVIDAYTRGVVAEEQMAALTGQEQPQQSDTPKLGVMLGQLTPEARQQFQLPADVKGVVVTEVHLAAAMV